MGAGCTTEMTKAISERDAGDGGHWGLFTAPKIAELWGAGRALGRSSRAASASTLVGPFQMKYCLFSLLFSLHSQCTVRRETGKAAHILSSRSLRDVLPFLQESGCYFGFLQKVQKKKLRETLWIQDPARPAWHCKPCWFTAALLFQPRLFLTPYLITT